MDLNLSNKKVLITGGSKGIGRAIKQVLEKEGAEVIDWSRTTGFDLMKEIPKIPKIDILINNVGGGGTWINSWEVMEKNYGIALNLTNQFIQKIGRGKVITISSPGFAAAKSAQIAFMKSLSGKHKNINFNVVCPGHIATNKFFPDNPQTIGKPEDVANLVVFLCSEKADHINGAVITVDGGESYAF